MPRPLAKPAGALPFHKLPTPARVACLMGALAESPTPEIAIKANSELNHLIDLVAIDAGMVLAPNLDRSEREARVRAGRSLTTMALRLAAALNALPDPVLAKALASPRWPGRKSLHVDVRALFVFAATLDRAAAELGMVGRPKLPQGQPGPFVLPAAPKGPRQLGAVS